MVKCCTYVVPVNFLSKIINKKAEDFSSAFVQAGRLELPHIAALDPKSNVSTNSTTPAFLIF